MRQIAVHLHKELLCLAERVFKRFLLARSDVEYCHFEYHGQASFLANPNRVNHVLIRNESERDRAAVHAVNDRAFPTPAEADLVDMLRQRADPVISLVAEINGVIVGHILFTPVELPGHPELKIMGLAPMAVAPLQQRSGVGSALVRAGIAQCRLQGFGAIVVLGHPAYYPRFGFSPSVRFGIGCEYPAPEDAFMLLELEPDYLRGAIGTVRYHAAFDDL